METGPKVAGVPTPNNPAAPASNSQFSQYMEEMRNKQVPTVGMGGEVKSTPIDPAEVQRRRQERLEKSQQRLKELGRTAPATAPAKEKGK
jgi:hypothetical protein